jgi:hypothetical protein
LASNPGGVRGSDGSTDCSIYRDCQPFELRDRIIAKRHNETLIDTSAPLPFSSYIASKAASNQTQGVDPMNDLADCRAMELIYRERANADPDNSWKWLGQAERWRDLGKQEAALRFQRRGAQQQMHAGPMAMGSLTVGGDSRSKQQG